MFRKYIKRVIYAVVLVVPFLILFFHPKNLKAPLLLDTALKPVGLLQAPVFELRKLFYYRETYDEYIRLKKQTDVLRANAIFLREQLEQSKQYDKIQEFRRSQNFNSLQADVIGRDPTNWNASLVINRGQADGVKIGQSVITTLGIVGKVIETGKTTSKVILLSDPNFAVAALVQRTRESGLLTGTLQGLCRLQYLTDNADVKVGDKIITSKLSSSFPEGIYIGTVVDVQAAVNSHTVECLVDPAVDLSQIEQVLIIKK